MRRSGSWRAPLRRLLVQATAGEAEEALGHENDHGREDDAHGDEVVLGEVARETLAEEQEEGRARDGPDQRSDTAHHVEDHNLAGYEEEDEVGRRELVLDRVEDAGEPREEPREHDGDDLVSLDRV